MPSYQSLKNAYFCKAWTFIFMIEDMKYEIKIGNCVTVTDMPENTSLVLRTIEDFEAFMNKHFLPRTHNNELY